MVGTSMTVGRRSSCDLVLPSSRVSGRHAELIRVQHQLFVRDLSSTNGTYVNRQRIRETSPLHDGDHVQFADVEFRVEFLGVAEPPRSSHEMNVDRKTCQCVERISDDWTFSRFQELLDERAIEPHFQPIVRLSDSRVVGYEALARSQRPGLESAKDLLSAATVVEDEKRFSQICRELSIEYGSQLGPQYSLYVNTHPKESLVRDVVRQIAELRFKFPSVRLIVEVNEAAVKNVPEMQEAADRLRHLNVKLSYDDFGAGRSRLLEILKVPPDILKFDRQLTSGLDATDRARAKLVRSLVEMARDCGATALAEQVESAAEAAACLDVGFELAQGYHFGQPMPASELTGGAE
ncbi:MAG: EAL domain-containing protein [Planctomycetaceae bacterium]